MANMGNLAFAGQGYANTMAQYEQMAYQKALRQEIIRKSAEAQAQKLAQERIMGAGFSDLTAPGGTPPEMGGLPPGMMTPTPIPMGQAPMPGQASVPMGPPGAAMPPPPATMQGPLPLQAPPGGAMPPGGGGGGAPMSAPPPPPPSPTSQFGGPISGGMGSPMGPGGAWSLQDAARRIQARNPGMAPHELFQALMLSREALNTAGKAQLDYLKATSEMSLRQAQVQEMQNKIATQARTQAAMTRIGETLGPNGEITPEARKLFFEAGLGDEYIKAQIGATLGDNLSKSPTYIRGPNGEVRIVQLSSRGAPHQTELPPGFSPAGEIGQIQTPTGVIPFDKRGGGVVSIEPLPGGAPAPAAVPTPGTDAGPARRMAPGRAPTDMAQAAPALAPLQDARGVIPKDVKGAQKQEVEGKAEGEAATAIPDAEVQAETTLALLKQLKAHPGRKMGQGSLVGRAPPLPGSAYDFAKLEEQVKGQAFLAVIQKFRGMGALSNMEGDKGTRAATRLDRALSPPEYDKAIDEMTDLVEKGLRALKKRAGQGGGADPAGGAPAAGTVKDGYRFKGGDPAQPASWEKVK